MFRTITTTTADFTPPCPTCPAPSQSAPGTIENFSVFGPCKDGRWHDSTCPIARREMAEAKWPCGQPKY
jgi:hypothetical protein